MGSLTSPNGSASGLSGVCAPRGANTPLRCRIDSIGNQLPAWARLDPFSTTQQLPAESYRRLTATRFAATARPTGRLGGFPTGRPWGFATEASPSAAIESSALRRLHDHGPKPFPRIPVRLPLRYQSVTTGGLVPLLVAGLSPAGQQITGGDVNPDCLDAFASISFGWPRRWPPTPAVPAINCFARLFCLEEVGLRIRSLFHFRRSLPCARVPPPYRATDGSRSRNQPSSSRH